MPIWLKETLISLLILGGGLAAAVAASFFLRLVRVQLFLNKGKTLGDELLFAARWPVFYLILAGGFATALNRLKAIYPDKTTGWIFAALDGFVFIVAVILVVYLLYRLAAAGLVWYSNLLAHRTQSPIDPQFVILFNRIARGVIFFLAVLAILDHFNVDIKGLLAVAGVSSLAFALAAQDTLSNMISGFILVADRPFRVGDRVQLASGESGRVTEIGLRSSRFITDDGSLLVVPNLELVRTRLVNHTFPDPQVRAALKFVLTHDAPVEKSKTIFEKAVFSTPNILHHPAPAVLFSDVTESGMEFSIFFWVADPDEKGKVAEGVRARALSLLRDNNIRLARREVLLKEEKKG